MKPVQVFFLMAFTVLVTVGNANPDPKTLTISTQIKKIMQDAEIKKPTSKNGEITVFFRINDNNEITVLNALAYDQKFINETRELLEKQQIFTDEAYKNRDLKIKIKYQPLK